jgi:hypothetical protein
VAANQVAEVRTVVAVNEQAVATAGPIVVVAVDSKVAVGVVAAVADATVVAIRFSARYVGGLVTRLMYAITGMIPHLRPI